MRLPGPLLPAAILVAALAGCASPGTVAAPEDGILDASTGRVVSFETMIDDLATVPMVYVGESHTNPEHHELQRRIIEALSARNPRIIVGMEMFQRPYAEVLDRWSAGGMDEAAFLREAAWFDQWGYPWGIYAPILRLARDRHLQVAPLALEFMTFQISRKGLAGLSADVRSRLPADIDLGVKAHEKAMREFFPNHPGMEKGDEAFRRFYEAQCTMDETMAESAVRALEGAPKGSAIVVLAGANHVKDFHAIPERARRRNGLTYRVVLPVERDEKERRAIRVGMRRPADYIVTTAPTPPSGGVMGVALRGGDSVVKVVAPGSAAAEAGLAEGDVLLTVEGKSIADVVDLKLALEGIAAGISVRFTWRRGETDMEGRGTLKAPGLGPVR